VAIGERAGGQPLSCAQHRRGLLCTLYSLVHGPSRDSCQGVAGTLSEQTGQEDYAVLVSEREFKKERLRYFLPELDRWWADRTNEADAVSS
jgi:hypothetical protein